jgi:hypothetical protein
MEFIQVEVGKRLPFEDVLQKMCDGGEGGASLNYNKEEKTMSLYIAIPKPTKAEIYAFRRDLVRFALYNNLLLDTSIIMVCFGVDFMFDLVYDINVLDMDMSGEVEGNRFDMFLIDSETGIVRGMRTLGLGQNFMTELNRVVRNDGRYTTKQYNEWLNNDVYRKPLKQLWIESERIDWDN